MSTPSDWEDPGNTDRNPAEKVVRRNGAMTIPTPFSRLVTDLAIRSRGREGRATLQRLSCAGVDLAGAASPLALACACHRPDRRAWAADTVSRLAALAPADETATLVVLVALGPGLLRLVRRLGRAGWPIEDASAVALAGALEALAGLGGHPVENAGRAVVAGTWARCRNDLRRADRHAGRSIGGPEAERVLATLVAGDPELSVDSVLDRAVRAGVLGARQARLLYETRALGRPLCEVAAEWGVPAGALTSLRRRAEGRLRHHLLTEVAQSGAAQ
jgi:DNA-directed RNA polymerase specialized sigma24 family protein